jgi:hypothetical protein
VHRGLSEGDPCHQTDRPNQETDLRGQAPQEIGWGSKRFTL